MLQIIDLKNNELFTQVSSEESAMVSGGTSNFSGIAARTNGFVFMILAMIIPMILTTPMSEWEH